MSSATETPQPKVTVDQNPAEWVNQNLSKAAAPDAPPQGTPAESPAVQPNPLELNLPEDFEHGFFRGKPVKELYKSFRATEAEMQRAQREAKELRDEKERLRAEVAAKNLAVQMAAEQHQRQTQPQDNLSNIERVWFENPKEAARLLREETLAEARRIAAETQTKTSAETIATITTRDRQTRATAAYEEARQRLNLDEATWQKRAKAVLAEITDPQSRYFGDGQTSGPLVTQNYIDAYKDIYGEPAPTVTVAPAKPAAGNPPGAHKPASTVAPPPNAGLPTLATEKRAALERTAQSLGIDPEKYITRYMKEVGQAHA